MHKDDEEKAVSEIQKKIDHAVGQALQKCLDSIPRQIESQMHKIVAQALGFQVDSCKGGWRVDHCNGRSSTVGNLVKGAAEKRAKAMIRKIADTFEVNKKLEDATIEDMERTFRSELRRRAREAAVRLAELKAEELAAKLVPNFAKANLAAMFDPSYGESEVETAAIKARLIMGEE